MIQNEEPVIANSLWTATANPAPDCPPLVGETEADVAIIGGGFTGLSAALHLAEAGQRVVLLEAETPGWGASGRNGGQVNPGLKEDPDEIEARFGVEVGKRMVRMSGGGADLVFGLIERHGISCSSTRSGWIQAAHNQAALTVMQARVAQWQKRGAPLEALDAAGIKQLIGTGDYVGGLIDRRGGNLHPLNYALGLAEVARKAGAQLYGQSRVQRLDSRADAHVIHTAKGVVTASRVLIATNGYADSLAPSVKQSVVPVRSVQVATPPLSQEIRAQVLPGLQSVSDSRRLLLYFRMTPEGRFVMGGRGAYGAAATQQQLQALRDVTARMFPVLADAKWEHAWGGYVAVTTDHFPHLNMLAPGVMAGFGYNGRGVAIATAMGKVMAEWAMGKAAADLDFPITDTRRFPFHFARKPGVTAAVAWNKLLDMLGL